MAELGPEIGGTLREARMRSRIDIGEVEMRTKIRAKYLRAMENEEWDLLPGPVYVKSFLRTYADHLGLDSRLLLDEYKRRFELSAEPYGRPLAAVKRDRERDQRRAISRRRTGVPSWALIALVLIAAGVGLYLISRAQKASAPRVARGVTHPLGHGTGSHRTRGTTRARRRTVTSATAQAPGTLATLRLVPTASVWVCVESPGGSRLVNGVVETPGTAVPTLRGSELLVTLGNANVTVTADGKPYPLSASATAIGLKVTPRGVSTLPRGPTCG